MNPNGFRTSNQAALVWYPINWEKFELTIQSTKKYIRSELALLMQLQRGKRSKNSTENSKYGNTLNKDTVKYII